METANGFILTRDCIDKNGIAEIHIYCQGNDGPFRIICTPHLPVFFISGNTADHVPLAVDIKSLQMTNMYNVPVSGCYFKTRHSYYAQRKQLKENDIPVYESDVKPAERFCMERNLHGGLQLKGDSILQKGIKTFYNPEIKASDFSQENTPDFIVLSLDIETRVDQSLYCIGCHIRHKTRKTSTVFMRGEGADTDLVTYCGSEKNVLLAFLEYLKNADPDLIIGWHVIGFDLKFLETRCRQYNIRFSIGRAGTTGYVTVRDPNISQVTAPGRIIIDGPGTLRMGFYTFEQYSLDFVANALLGTGKSISDDENKVLEIERRFREDKQELAEYNLLDCTLTADIFEKTSLIEQLYTRSCITGMQMDKVHMSVASFDYFFLPKFHRKGYVAPDTDDVSMGNHAAGGYVFSSEAGLYDTIAVLDFKSLYPTIIRSFKIDPYSLLKNNIKPVTTPSGHTFSGTEYLLPDFLGELMDKRQEAKKKNQPYMAQAVKILMNSFYGVMGTPGCRFYNSALPSAITETGQWLLKESAAFINSFSFPILYGDTDSLFVQMPGNGTEADSAAAQKLSEDLNDYWKQRLLHEYNIESFLEMEFEKLYTKLFLPPLRGESKGATKRYAGLLPDGTLELKGLEYVRSDWTALAKDFQYTLFQKLFSNTSSKTLIEEWIKEYVHDIRTGKHDGKLLYKRKLTKPAEEYIKTIPPHVKAAKMLDPDGKKRIRRVEYIMSKEGPLPTGMAGSGPDYDHYIEKQIKPLADSVLSTMGISFEEIINGRQLDLFS